MKNPSIVRTLVRMQGFSEQQLQLVDGKEKLRSS